MKKSTHIKTLQDVGLLAVGKIQNFKNYGRITKRIIDQGDTNYHHLLIQFDHKKPPFSWNEDHDFCERHYDGFGVIDNCPLFNEWNEFAQQTAKELSKKHGVGVKVELEGFKYELTIDVQVFSNPVLAM